MVELDQGGRSAGRASLEPVRGVLSSMAEHSFILLTSDEHAASWRIVPDLSAHLIFHFSGDPERPTPWRASVCGARTVHCDAPVRQRAFSVGVRLNPGALAALTRVPASELVDRGLLLSDLWPKEASRLMSRADDDPSPEAARNALLMLLSEVASGAPDPDWRVRSYASLLRSVPGISLDRAAEVLGMGARTLRRACVEHVGLTPKRMARIARLYRGIAASINHQHPGSRISAGAGFTDQSHMIREFRALLGETPHQFSSRRSAA